MDNDRRLRREAIFLTIKKEILHKKERGDLITEAECVEALDGELFLTFISHIRRFYRTRGIELVRVPEEGYRLATSTEQSHDVARGHQRKRLRQSHRSLISIQTSGEEDMSSIEKERRLAMLKREAAVTAELTDAEIQTRKLLGESNVKVSAPRLIEKPRT